MKKPLLLNILIAACLLLAGAAQAGGWQKKLAEIKISVEFKEETLDEALIKLERLIDIPFSYDRNLLANMRTGEMSFKNEAANIVLKKLLHKNGLVYEVDNNNIVVSKEVKSKAARSGRITGTVLDEAGQGLPGASVRVVELNTGMQTSVDGTYTLSVEAGTYTIEIRFLSYQTQQITQVVVEEGKITTLNVAMKPAASMLNEVVVTSNFEHASVEALYTRQKNSTAITDGISAEQISRTPDKNIGEVLKRVSGLSTMENKYVVVRGLSERYNQAVLNNQVMPSTELNRKNFSFDIIPSNIVEHVTVVKTLTPDRNAEFGGGLVEVKTLDIPAQDFLNASAGSSVNSLTTGKNFRSLKLDGSEYLGKAAPHRNLLGKLDWNSTSEIISQYNKTENDATQFSNNWGVYEMNAPVSQNYQFSAGKVFRTTGENQLGVVMSASYRNNFQKQNIRMSRDNFEEADADDVDHAGFAGKRYGFTTNLGGLAGIGYKTPRTRLGYQTIFLRTLDQQLVIGQGYHSDPSGWMLGYYDLTTQTDMWQHQLKGEHSIGSKGVKFTWTGSYLELDKQKPDNHQLLAHIPQDEDLESNEFSIRSPFSSSLSSGVLRWWSRAYEKNFNWDAAVSVPFDFNTGKLVSRNTFRAGYAGWRKDRLFYVLNTGSANYDTQDYPPLAEAFSPERGGNIYISEFSDDFHKTASLHGMYLMLDDKIGDKWRLAWGVRAEYYNLNKANAALDSLFAQINSTRGNDEKYDYSELLNREPDWNFFPSANLTYNLTPSMNLRLAYAKSIIRPDLREMSFFREYDFELGGIYQAGLVKSTIAHHYDFRYEWYPGAGELLSMSLFYKKFDYSMEIYNDEQSGGIFDLKNNKSTKNYGLELEARKSLGFTKVPVVKNITLYGNLTVLRSFVTSMDVNYNALDPDNPLKVTPVETYGKEVRRPQTGASNYTVNAGIFYDTRPASFSLLYNYVSNRMFRPDASANQSLYERPLTSLDAQVAVRFFKQKGEVKLNFSNLLNSYSMVYRNMYKDEDLSLNRKTPSTKELLYKKGIDQINYEAKPGRTYGITISYKL